MGIGWNLWGMLPHSLPQQIATGEHKIIEMAKDPWNDPNPQPGDLDAELKKAQVEIQEGNPDAELSIHASRATEMQALLRHTHPHGGNAAERVKQTRPNDRSA